MEEFILIVREHQTSHIKVVNFSCMDDMDDFLNSIRFKNKYTVYWSNQIDDNVYYMVVYVNKEYE